MARLYPERMPTSPWLQVGDAFQQAAGIVGNLDTKLQEQEHRRNVLQDMVEKRTQAKMKQMAEEREAIRKEAEDRQKAEDADRRQKSMETFYKYTQGEQNAKPQAPAEPYYAPGLGPNGEAMREAPQEFETIKPSRQQMMDKALELGVYGDEGVRAYFDDTAPRMRGGLSNEEWYERETLREKLRAGRPMTDYEKARVRFWEDQGERGAAGLDLSRERLGFQRDKFERQETEQDTDRLTKFVKNTNELKTEIDMFGKLDQAVPGGIYGKGGVAGFGFGTKPFRKFWKSEEANQIRPTLQFLINAILKRNSGAAVTDQEFERMETALGINTTGTVEEFRSGLQNYYESAKNQYDRFVTADRASAGYIDGQGNNLNPSAPPPRNPAPMPRRTGGGSRDPLGLGL